MPRQTQSPLRVLIFHASLRKNSFNGQLARLAAQAVERAGGIADRAAMSDFDWPSYSGDVESTQGIPNGAEQLSRRLKGADAFSPHT
ncbi:MAG: NAD(P)H-dependent oxidoreductase [Gemmatimonadaceae bacterium]